MTQLVWFRNDLRLSDNPALCKASQVGPVVCVYLIAPEQWLLHRDAPAKQLLWRARVQSLQQALKSKNIPLLLLAAKRYEDAPEKLLMLAQKLHCQGLWFNREYALNETRRDKQVSDLLTCQGIAVNALDGDVIRPPGSVKTQTGSTYHVFTPFARQWRKQFLSQDIELFAEPEKQDPLDISGLGIDDEWSKPSEDLLREDLWPVDDASIEQRLLSFVQKKSQYYGEQRDFPSVPGTSTLSPYLACGAVSVRQCFLAYAQYDPEWFNKPWTTELIWREFYRHLLAEYPHLSRSENFKATKEPIPWENNEAHWQAWCRGETGFPIVDAAMKQLLQTGWMHNRLRMVVAAFLTKLLLIDWRKGEAFFMQHLLDGDYASNNGGWQWAASTGADAAPYFRIFNPERQSQRFDPDGVFIKKFLPQLTPLDAKSIHNPKSEQRSQCVYQEPIIDYKFARQRALDVYASAMGKA